MRKVTITLGCICALAALDASHAARAAVSADEAAKLKTTLTPVGAERAGNADGTIPAWTGGMATNGARPDKIYTYTDPFADEKPLFRITSANVSQYADKLSEGTKALIAKFPDTFFVDVYPTHRTFANPQFVYDNTFKNATKASLDSTGNFPVGAWGGIPFPIPKNGAEVMWNHILRYSIPNGRVHAKGYSVTAIGQHVLNTDTYVNYDLPYYNEPAPTGDGNDVYLRYRFDQLGPPIRAGEGVLLWYALNPDHDEAWIYLTGQRRVRKLPNACCDVPHPVTAGVMGYDEVYVWTGRLDRYEWELVGKKEMYIPANSNRSVVGVSDDEYMGTKHYNPDKVRFELRRVWIVKAKLRPDKRHTAPNATFYIDEDSWVAVQSERYDVKGELWKLGINPPVIFPEIPTTFPQCFGFNDIITGTSWYGSMTANVSDKINFVDYPPGYFTQDDLAGSGIR